jgi:hypothetical protein
MHKPPSLPNAFSRRTWLTMCLGVALGAALLSSPGHVHAQQAAELSGVRFEPQLDLQGKTLVLNGAGIRYKAIFKVYAAGLYLPAKAHTPEAVLAQQDGPRRLSITMLREIDSNELGKLFTRGVEDNTPRGEFSKLVPGLIRMGEIFASHKKLQPGDVFTIDWVPGQGTVISVKGVQQGDAFKGPEFFNALMRIWLGKSPADNFLKDALLGITH